MKNAYRNQRNREPVNVVAEESMHCEFNTACSGDWACEWAVTTLAARAIRVLTAECAWRLAQPAVCFSVSTRHPKNVPLLRCNATREIRPMELKMKEKKTNKQHSNNNVHETAQAKFEKGLRVGVDELGESVQRL
jgi:hypothetical protein